jgi:hypothetical protein
LYNIDFFSINKKNFRSLLLLNFSVKLINLSFSMHPNIWAMSRGAWLSCSAPCFQSCNVFSLSNCLGRESFILRARKLSLSNNTRHLELPVRGNTILIPGFVDTVVYSEFLWFPCYRCFNMQIKIWVYVLFTASSAE